MCSDRIIDSNLKETIEAEIREQKKLNNYNTESYSLEYFSEKISHKQIENNLQWNERQQSYFVESLLLGLPVLNIVVKRNPGNADSDIEIIDGRQRIYTAINFLNNNLTLSNLNKLTTLNGFKFMDLTLPRQKSFRKLSVRTIVAAQNSDNRLWRKLS